MEQKIQENIDLFPYTSIKIGGPAAYLAHPKTFDQLIELLSWASERTIPVKIIGGGSNILISEHGIKALVIDTKGLKDIHIRGTLLTAYCGNTLEDVITTATEYSMAGLETFSGLPGTIGGAVHGNIGCFGHDIAEFIEWVEYLTCDGALHHMIRDQYHDTYRDSPFKHHPWMITEVCFNLQPGKAIAIQSRGKEYRKKRRDNGQYRYHSMGSVFKNPIDPSTGVRISAGKLIDEAGLKGYRMGGAQVADYHGNIIINPRNEATADDIHRLIEHIRSRIEILQDIKLETEIDFLGS